MVYRHVMGDSNDSLPRLGDHTNTADLLSAMTESMRTTLATRLGLEWRKQNPDALTANASQPLAITIDFNLLQSICSELSRNVAQAIVGLPLVDVYGLVETEAA